MSRFLKKGLIILGGSILLVAALLGMMQGEQIIKTLPAPGPSGGYYAYGLTWDGHNLWVGDDRYGDLYKVDPADGTVLDTIPGAPESNHGLTWDGEYLWVSGDYHTDYIYQIDTLGVKIDSMLNVGGDYSGGLTWQGDRYLWVSRYYPNTQPNLFKVDTTTGVAVDTIPSQGLQPQGLAWDGEYLWNVMDDNDDDPEKVWKLDPATGDTLMWFWVPGAPQSDARPRGLTWDGGYLWLVANSNLYQIDPYGTGTPEIELSATEHNYGSVIIDSISEWELGISNIGGADLIVDSLSFDHLAFSTLGTFPDTIEPDSTHMVVVRFLPSNYGLHSCTLTVYSNDPVTPTVDAALSGFGMFAEQEIDISTSSHNYGLVRVLGSKRWKLHIQNQGAEPLEIYKAVFDKPDFYIMGVDYPVVIDSLGSYDLPIWFSPSYGGSFGSLMTLYNNDEDEDTIFVDLSGTGDPGPFVPGEVLYSFQATNYDPTIKAIKSVSDVNGDGVDDVVAASENDTIYCFNGNSSGSPDILWTYVTSSLYREQELIRVPDLDGDEVGDVVIGTPWGGRSIIAISGKTGEQIWQHDTHEYGDGGWVYEVALTIDVNGDTLPDILAAAGDDSYDTGPGGAYCLSGASGGTIWHKRLAPYGTHVAAFSVRGIDDINDDGIPEVAVGTGDTDPDVHRVWLLNGATGDTIWSYVVGDAVWAVAPIADVTGDGKKDIVAGAGVFSGVVYLFDVTYGRVPIWSKNLDGGVEKVEISSDVNSSGYDDIVPSGLMSTFYCLEGLDGGFIWSYPSGHMAFSASVIPDVNGDHIPDVIGGSGYNVDSVYFFNGKTGEEFWSYPAGSAVEATGYLPHVAGSSTPVVLAGTRDGLVLALAAGNIVVPVQGDRIASSLPCYCELLQNYPNPFNSTTAISYQLSVVRGQLSAVTLKIYNILGQEVGTLVDGWQKPGYHQVVWNGKDRNGKEVASGIYLCRLKTEGVNLVKKMILLK
jgi:hypothetical protein